MKPTTPTPEKMTLFEKLKKADLNYRFETNDDEFRLSIINRQVYPRVWIDDFNDDLEIIIETEANFQNRILMSDKDWVKRFFGENIQEIEDQFDNWIKNLQP